MTQPAPVPTPPPGDPAPVPTPPPTPPVDPPDNGKGSDRSVLADLAKERDKRQELEKQLAELAPLKQIADIITGGQKPPDGKSEAVMLNERLEKYENDLTAERTARWRAEVAAAKGLTADQAAWISGTTAEEFAASADKLLASFPAGPRNPAPDPSQGARGPGGAIDLAAQVAEATKAGDWRKVAALEKTKLANVKR